MHVMQNRVALYVKLKESDMKILILVIALLNGFYMLIDGIKVILCGKYFGTEEPGPWAYLFYKLNMDVYKLGPIFIIFGLLWLICCWWLWKNYRGAFWFGIILSFFTLWYIPVGAFFSIVIIAYLYLKRTSFDKKFF